MNSRSTAFLAVIIILGLALLGCIGGVITLAAFGLPLPDLLKEVAVGCLSGLGGMLVHPPATQDDPTPVVVQQPADQPVPVDADTGPTFDT